MMRDVELLQEKDKPDKKSKWIYEYIYLSITLKWSIPLIKATLSF